MAGIGRAESADIQTPAHRKAIKILQRAAELALRDLLDVWEYAVELRELLNCGLQYSEIRSLVHRGYLYHGVEASVSKNGHRIIRARKNLRLIDRSCFVLSPLGARNLGKFVGRMTKHSVPHWNCEGRRLSYCGFIVKSFRQPATNQEAVLTEFQKYRWVSRIADPLPHDGEVRAKTRLHDTVKALNRRQRKRLIQFGGDGTGMGIVWRPLPG